MAKPLTIVSPPINAILGALIQTAQNDYAHSTELETTIISKETKEELGQALKFLNKIQDREVGIIVGKLENKNIDYGIIARSIPLVTISVMIDEIKKLLNETIVTDEIQEPEEIRTRNDFNGEVKLDEILINTILTLNPQTGYIEKIEVLGHSKTPKTLKANQIHATIAGNEFVKETLTQEWSDDPQEIAIIEREIKKTLLKDGIKIEDDKSFTIGEITNGQIPSARAWVNPDKKLREKWENSSRKTLAEERLERIR